VTKFGRAYQPMNTGRDEMSINYTL